MESMTNSNFNEAAYHAAANAHGREILWAIVIAFLLVCVAATAGYVLICAVKGHFAFRREAMNSPQPPLPNVRHNPPRPRHMR